MNLERGDVLKARFPHASGTRGKKRPVVVVQANTYNQRLRHAVVAQITANLAEQSDPSCILIKANTPEAIATGIQRHKKRLKISVVICKGQKVSANRANDD